MKQDWLFCKHQLAMHLSTAMDHFITLQVTDKEFTKLLNENWNIKEWWQEWNKWKMKRWLGNYGQLSTMTVSLPCCSMHFCTALIMVASRRSIALRWAGVRMGQRGSRRMLRSSSSERDILSTDSSASFCHVEERNLNVKRDIKLAASQTERERDWPTALSERGEDGHLIVIWITKPKRQETASDCAAVMCCGYTHVLPLSMCISFPWCSALLYVS